MMTMKQFIDLSPFLVGIGGLVVALVTVWVTRDTAKDNLAISERQIELERAKVRSDLFDRRYAAWLQIRDASEARYRAILAASPTDRVQDVLTRDMADDFRNAADKLYFLFDDEVHKAITELNGRLTAFHVAKAGEVGVTGRQAQVFAEKRTLDADEMANLALDSLKVIIKSHMQPTV